MVHVVYRCCDSVESETVRRRTWSAPVWFPKQALMKACLKSFDFCNAGSVHVVPSRCSGEYVQFVRQNVPGCVVHQSADGGNGESFGRCCEIASSLPEDDFCFFLEDDYFALVPDVVSRIEAGLKLLSEAIGRRAAIMPDDYPDRWTNGTATAEVRITKAGHFMRIHHSTCTFAASVRDIRGHMDELLRFRLWPKVGEDGSINAMWQEVPLYQPLPALTMHTQTRKQVPPYVDVGRLVDLVKAVLA